jgi:hypothetical protein
VEAHCISVNQTIEDWSKNVLSHRKWAPRGASLCNASNIGNGSIAHLHVFGSNASGPYLHGIDNTPADPFMNTDARLCKGIELYSHHVGLPTLIVFQIMLWDIYVLHEMHHVPEQVKVQKYRDNMIARVKEIQRCKNRRSALVLRTAPAMLWGKRLIVLFNEVIRSIATDMGIGIVDYDAMVWGMDRSASREKTLFRDHTHPRIEISTRFASHLLRLGAALCKRGARTAAGVHEDPTWALTS